MLDQPMMYALIGITILLFLFKGIVYLLIGSYIPLALVAIFSVALFYSLHASTTTHLKVIQAWAIFILVWGTVRFGLWLALQFDQSLTESHLREQFSLIQHFISAVMIFMGFRILKILRRMKAQKEAI